MEYKFDINGSYYCRVKDYEQNKTNPMSLGSKMREELSVEGRHPFGGFLGVGVNRGGFEKISKI